MHYTKPSASRLLQLMEQKIVILDGAMGTMIQQHNLTEEEFRGKVIWKKLQSIFLILLFKAITICCALHALM